jgi:hypothetical protein
MVFICKYGQKRFNNLILQTELCSGTFKARPYLTLFENLACVGANPTTESTTSTLFL